MTGNTKIYELLRSPMTGPEIERRSFDIIDCEADRSGFCADQWEVVRRLLHTTADFNIIKDIRFSDDSISMGVQALRKRAGIYVDSNMIRSGLSLARLKSVNPEYDETKIRCHVADPDIGDKAKEKGLPRSLFAARKAKHIIDGGIALIGNAPVALLEINRMIVEEGIKPSLVIGMPVGFVHVMESKDELMSTGIPYIVITGRRGGSPLAVSVLHALCTIATAGDGER